MNYKSTRNSRIKATAAEAITKGLSSEGGLFVPENLPKLSPEEISALCEKSYPERAFEIFKLFLTDFSDEEIRFAVNNAYSFNSEKQSKFESETVTELSHLLTGTYILELWHGPTCAFKDMALQILPYLLTISAKKTISGKEILILVATSGDTGKAALEGFKDVEGTKITVFYPEDGVSPMQKRQMTTQEGGNVFVAAVKGNFDDCQNGVKEIFTDPKIITELEKQNMVFSSANSINWGRLSPQIVYYVSVYADLLKNHEIELGEEINVAVPTGNFGNILAAYYAREMGVPIKKLICASNKNKILTDFINTGIYDRNREFYTTDSPSMDILISSNLERLLYHLSDENDEKINEWFSELKKKGKYEVGDNVKERINSLFYGGYCTDEETKETIKKVFDEYSYLLDTHTAVAYKVYNEYKKTSGDETKTIIISTANPYKFVSAVYEALGGEDNGSDEFETAEKLEKLTGTVIPEALKNIKNKSVRFNGVFEKSEMHSSLKSFIE